MLYYMLFKYYIIVCYIVCYIIYYVFIYKCINQNIHLTILKATKGRSKNSRMEVTKYFQPQKNDKLCSQQLPTWFVFVCKTIRCNETE